MAERPKRNVRQPKRFDNSLEFAEVIASAKPVKKQKKDNNLYEIEVTEVDSERKLVRIHYKGYDSRFDECRPYDNDQEYFPFVRYEKLHVPNSYVSRM